MKREENVANVIFYGLHELNKIVKRYNYDYFNKPHEYGSLFVDLNMTKEYMDEMNLLYSMFIDPWTAVVLESRGEPTDYYNILIRIVEILMTDYYKHSNDMSEMLHRGSDRLSMLLYKELINAYAINASY